MSKKKGQKITQSLIPKSAASRLPKPTYLNKNVAIMEGWKSDGDNSTVFLSLRFVEHEHECFSEWDKSEMKAFWDFQSKIHDYTWQSIKNQSGKTTKTGFGCTVMPASGYPNKKLKNDLSPDTTYIEMRVNQKIRVHGFRSESIFYVCWLDKNHSIFPS